MIYAKKKLILIDFKQVLDKIAHSCSMRIVKIFLSISLQIKDMEINVK